MKTEKNLYKRLVNVLKEFEGQPFTPELRDEMAEKAAEHFTSEEIRAMHVGIVLDNASRAKE